MMEKMAGILMGLAVLGGVGSWHNEKGTFKGRENIVAKVIGTEGTGTGRKFAPLNSSEPMPMSQPVEAHVSRSAEDPNADELKLAHADAMRIVKVAKAYGVPENALFGIWMMESRGLSGGWGTNLERWVLAKDMAKPGSKCAEHYGAESCAMRFQRLRHICTGQAVKVCDPETVRVTYGMAMGPTQQMPQWTWLQGEAGTYGWSDSAVDFDGDGAINPLDLDDALANTARQLRASYDKAVKRGDANPWREAVIRYAGKPKGKGWKTHYYDGRVVDGKAQAGVSHYWTAWSTCRAQKNCPAEIVRLRTR